MRVSFSPQKDKDNDRLRRECEAGFGLVIAALPGQDAEEMVKGHKPADYELTGWGANATAAPSEGTNDARGRVTFTTGAGVGADPTVTVTWRDPSRAPSFVVASRGNMQAMTSGSGEWRVTATTQRSATFTLVGQPVASVDYVLDFRAE